MTNQTAVTPSDLLTDLFNVLAPEKTKRKRKRYDFDDSLADSLLGLDMDDADAETGIVSEKDAGSHARSAAMICSFIDLPQMQKYALTAEEVLIIVKCWGEFLADGRSYFRSSNLVSTPESADFDAAMAVTKIIDLLDRKIFKFNSHQNADYHYNPALILEECYTFDAWFLSALLGRDFYQVAQTKLESRLAAEQYNIEGFLDFVKVLLDSYPELSERIVNVQGYYYGAILAPAWEFLSKTLDILPANLHLNLLKSKYQLSALETVMILVIYYIESICRGDIPSNKLLNLFAADEAAFDRMQYEIIHNPAHPLHLVLDTEDSFFSHRSDLTLNEAAQLLLKSQAIRPDSALSEVQQQIADSKVLSLLKTSQTIESLILPQETKAIITSMIVKMQDPATYSLAQWGLLSESLTDDKSVLNGVCMLLHGNPGTGKTFAAGAIANALGKELVSINAAFMKSKWYGESQQVVRNTFAHIRKIIADTANPPVFLLNEADQLIHARIDLSHSCAEIDNAIQNIILEELETFPGLLIATTNLVVNLDVAYSRRFAYKIELPLPDEDCRRQLWKLHLPATIPGAAEIDIAYLAKKHSISGGQIKVIVQNACSAAIIRPTAERRLTMLDIVKYAELEDNNSFETKSKTIGFGK